ncbi:MAG: nucleotidyltransferase family protein [bacterium]|nr:nucleotidyltransferase family protein [bacterium]
MKTLKEIVEILAAPNDELKRRYKVKEIGIFGSFVRNEQKETSDIDILVEFEELPDLLKFIEIERYLEMLLGLRVDLIRKSVLRKELKERVLKEVVNI